MDAPDLLTLAEAATASERSPSTIRRWLRTGALTRHEGPIPEHGGSPPVLVNRTELLGLLATTGQKPREPDGHPADAHPGAPVVTTSPAMVDTPSRDAIRLAELEGRLALAELRADLVRAEAELEASRREAHQLEALVAELRRDRDDWRDRHDARAAELRAVAEASGTSWWRRLLGGPVVSMPPVQGSS